MMTWNGIQCIKLAERLTAEICWCVLVQPDVCQSNLVISCQEHWSWCLCHKYCQRCGVRDPRSPGFGLESELESESLIWRRLRLRALPSYLDFCVILLQSIWLLCNLFYN